MCILAIVAGCASDSDDGDTADPTGAPTSAVAPLPEEYTNSSSELYTDDASWLCRPEKADDVCARDLDATVVHTDGSVEIERHEPAVDPAVDCFYVYPTVSTDPGPNTDMEPAEAEEVFVTYNQAARLTATCRVFAPVYRQLPLSAIGGGDTDAPSGVDPREVAYGDVLDAFRHYVANDSDGRGFVLIGHSQGAGHLRRLIAEEIDDEPALGDRLVSAYLLGSTVAVPEGDVVGGDFATVPLCETEDQVGCVVTYASFRSTAPPPESSFFARVGDGDGVAGCVNPANLAGGTGWLRPYGLVENPAGALAPQGTTGFQDPEQAPEITTPFVTLPEFVEARCVAEGEFHYLELTVRADPADPRIDDIGGDLTPEWGMHLIDVNVAMGNIVELVAAQATAYAG